MFYLGLDLGQRRDHSAIAVIEKWYERLEVRYLERVPLGTAYTEVANRVIGLVRRLAKVTVVVDATGVGAPVIDLLRAGRIGCEMVPVSITGGERASRHGPVWNVPKKDLISGLEVLVEHGEMRVAKSLTHAASLLKEMGDMRRERLAADGAGQHDDLVIAVALACWKAKQTGIGFVPQRLPGI